MSTDPLLIGIAGPSCSGKSSIARRLANITLGPTVVLPMDHYYRDFAAIAPQLRPSLNFDAPQAIDLPLLLENLIGLKAGERIEKPRYLFTEHVRAADGEVIEPQHCVVVEGLFALYWEELRRLLSVCVFVEAPDAVCLERRLVRDELERGRSRESILRQFEETVRPMYRRFVEPTRAYAQIVVCGSEPLARSADSILSFLNAVP